MSRAPLFSIVITCLFNSTHLQDVRKWICIKFILNGPFKIFIIYVLSRGLTMLTWMASYRDPPASVFQVLELEVCTSMPGCLLDILRNAGSSPFSSFLSGFFCCSCSSNVLNISFIVDGWFENVFTHFIGCFVILDHLLCCVKSLYSFNDSFLSYLAMLHSNVFKMSRIGVAEF